MPSPLPASRPGASRFIPPRRGGFTYRHLFARPSDYRHGQGAGDRRRWHRRCARRNRRPGSWRRCRANGNGIPGVRGVRRQPPSSPGFTREKTRTHRADKGLHRKTSAGNPQPLAGGVEPGGDGDSTLSVATRTCQKPRDPGRGGGPIGSPAPMGRAKRQSFGLHERASFLERIDCGNIRDRRAGLSVERPPTSKTFQRLKWREKMPRWTRCFRLSRIASAVFVVLLSFQSKALAQGKDRLVEHPTFYRTIQIDGLSIFYREAGPKDAPVILLLHGLPSSSRMFEPLFARLSDRFRMVAPDYPGFGHSDWPDPKKFAYTFDHYAEIMNHFTQAIGLSRYTLYMQDYGGPVGFRLALAHPERVVALIIQNAVAHNDGLGAIWATRRAFWADRSAHEEALRENLLSFATTKSRHVGDDPNIE